MKLLINKKKDPEEIDDERGTQGICVCDSNLQNTYLN